MKTISMSYEEYEEEKETLRDESFKEGLQCGEEELIRFLAHGSIEDLKEYRNDLTAQKVIEDKQATYFELLNIVIKGREGGV